MIYRSADTIPAKLYFKIIETGDISLLSDEVVENLQDIWEKIQAEDDNLSPDSETDKILEIYSKVESLAARHKSILLSVRHLRFKKDSDLVENLRNKGYQVRWNPDQKENLIAAEAIYQNDLDEVERLSEDIIVQISRIQTKIPKKKIGKVPHFDEVVMSFSAFTGSGFIDTNLITLTQYRALIKMGGQKIKALENGPGR